MKQPLDPNFYRRGPRPPDWFVVVLISVVAFALSAIALHYALTYVEAP